MTATQTATRQSETYTRTDGGQVVYTRHPLGYYFVTTFTPDLVCHTHDFGADEQAEAWNSVKTFMNQAA